MNVKTAKKKMKKGNMNIFTSICYREEKQWAMITWVNSTQASFQMTSLFIFISLVPCKVPQIYRTLKHYLQQSWMCSEIETYCKFKQTCSWNRQANYPNLNKNCDNIFHEKKYLPPIPQSYLENRLRKNILLHAYINSILQINFKCQKLWGKRFLEDLKNEWKC